jgi:hypothetical protein
MNYDLSARLIRTNPGIGPLHSAALLIRDWTGILWHRCVVDHRYLPDIDDDATRGALLGRLRVLTKRPHLCPCYDGISGWAIVDDGTSLTSRHDTEQEALVAGFDEIKRVES